MADDEEVDIYGGLPDYDFDKKQKELEIANQNLRRRVKVLECENHALKSENKKLAKRESSLNRNISVLYATALAELEFKNKSLADLAREKESILFRRSGRSRLESRPNEDQPQEEEVARSPNVSREASEESRKSKDKKIEEKANDRGKGRQRRTRPPLSPQEERRVLRSGDRGRRPQRRSENRESKPVKKPQSPKIMPVRKPQSPKKMTVKKPKSPKRATSNLKAKSKDTERKEVKSPDSKKQSAERLLETLYGPCASSTKEKPIESNSAQPEQLEPMKEPEAIAPEGTATATSSVPKKAKNKKSAAKVPDVENQSGERHSDTSIESHASSSKENAKESRILRAERMHKEKKGDSPISLTTEVRRISPRKKQVLDSNQNKSEDEDSNYTDLLSSLLESEKERINSKTSKKKKKKVSMAVSTKDNPETPGKFLIEGSSLSESVPQPGVVQNGSSDDKSLSPELHGPPETPGKYLVGHVSSLIESSPTKSAEKKQKELESAIFSILPTPLKLMAQNPLLLSPLQDTPVSLGPPQIIKTPEETIVASDELPDPKTPPPTQHVSPDQSFNTSIVSTNSTQLMIDLSRTGDTPKAAPPIKNFPFKRKRVLKIKCISTGNSSLEESKDTSVEEPPSKKACATTETQVTTEEPSTLSPIKMPEPPAITKIVPSKPPVPKVKKLTTPATKKQSPKPKAAQAIPRKKSVSPAKKMTTPQHQMQAPPSSIPSTGRKSNDSGTSQDFHLHYTSESEISRSPSPFVPQHHSSSIATSTPHPTKMQLKQVAATLKALTPNSKKKQKRKMSEIFGDSPHSEREYQLDMEVTEDMRNDLEESRAELKHEKRKLTEEEWRQRERLRRDSFERSRKSPDRSKLRHSPEYQRRSSPVERTRRPDERRWSPEDRRRSPERDRRRTPERERRRSPERERRRTPERGRRRSPERERRRSPDDRERRRSPYDWERRRSPGDKERRRSPTESERRKYIEERRRSPEHRDRRRPTDERDKRQIRRSRSVERTTYPSSSRRSPGPSYRKKSRDRRTPSPYESHSRREYSDSPAREESRRHRKESRSISPRINGSSRSYSGRRNEEKIRHKEPSPTRPSHNDYLESRGQRSTNYDNLEKRGDKFDKRKGDFRSEEEKKLKGPRDLRKVIEKAKTREVNQKKTQKVPKKRPSANDVSDETSEEGEVESD